MEPPVKSLLRAVSFRFFDRINYNFIFLISVIELWYFIEALKDSKLKKELIKE